MLEEGVDAVDDALEMPSLNSLVRCLGFCSNLLNVAPQKRCSIDIKPLAKFSVFSGVVVIDHRASDAVLLYEPITTDVVGVSRSGRKYRQI